MSSYWPMETYKLVLGKLPLGDGKDLHRRGGLVRKVCI